MKRCSVKPYEGNEKYIFVSYCHKDSKYVFPIIEQLARDGFRVWYDEGIDPGSEWPEIIAQHLNGCFACIAFISENSLNSHNCRREINFALLKKKSFITVVLEQVQLSLGMEMQLSATQSIFKYTLSNDYDFFCKLYEAKFLKDCKGEPDLSIVVSNSSEYSDNHNDMFSESEKHRDTFSDKWFVGTKSENVVIEKNEEINNEPEKYKFILIRVNTNEGIIVPEGEMKIGRSNTMSDYVITGNSAIGRYHARIVCNGNNCTLIDNNSVNKTYINGLPLIPGTEYSLNDCDEIIFANEKFVFNISKE